jgi:hypothetical protein
MITSRLRLILPLWILAPLLLAADSQPPAIAPEVQRAIDRVSPDSLRGHVSFLASDLLEGRGTPSRGLDIAAEYIAAQFRRAGLEAAGDDGYYQTARLESVEQSLDGFRLTIESGGKRVEAGAEQVAFRTPRAVDLTEAGAVAIEVEAISSLQPEQVAGKAVIVALPRDGKLSERMRSLAALHPAAVLDTVSKNLAAKTLVDPTLPRLGVAWVALRDSEALHLLRSVKHGAECKISLHLAAPVVTAVRVRNVVALLRGSDPVLRDSYIVLSAHYDHLGVGKDRIFHGANDDGSGTASVIEISQALATLRPRPRRSIVFLALFGEEEGLLGSLYYTRHPIFPLKKTIANLNLEQLGRTDASEGREVANATLTGFDFSDLSATVRRAGRLTGIKVYRSSDGGDAYFDRSDNAAFARKGIPAHTAAVAFEFPDYHAPNDTWEKIDYENLAKVDRMLALAVVLVANNPAAPRWNLNNPKTVPYRKRAE